MREVVPHSSVGFNGRVATHAPRKWEQAVVLGVGLGVSPYTGETAFAGVPREFVVKDLDVHAYPFHFSSGVDFRYFHDDHAYETSIIPTLKRGASGGVLLRPPELVPCIELELESGAFDLNPIDDGGVLDDLDTIQLALRVIEVHLELRTTRKGVECCCLLLDVCHDVVGRSENSRGEVDDSGDDMLRFVVGSDFF